MTVAVVLGVVLIVLLTAAVVLRPRGGGGTDLISSFASSPDAPAPSPAAPFPPPAAPFPPPAASFPPPAAAGAFAALDDATRWRIEKLAASGRRVAAIEALRDATGCGMAHAKAAVDRIPPYGPGDSGSARFLLDEVRGLAYAGRVNEAAEHLRARTGMSLPDAQQAVRDLLFHPR